MTRRKKILVYTSATAFLLASVSVVSVRAQLDHAHELGKRIKCTCGGCEQTAGTCYHVGGEFSGPCGVAKQQIKEIQAHLDKGLSDDKVIDAMIKEYGTAAYVEPPKSGFGLVAWLMPGVYLVLGALLVFFIMARWRKRAEVAEAMAPEKKAVSPEALERARALAQKATEE